MARQYPARSENTHGQVNDHNDSDQHDHKSSRAHHFVFCGPRLSMPRRFQLIFHDTQPLLDVAACQDEGQNSEEEHGENSQELIKTEAGWPLRLDVTALRPKGLDVELIHGDDLEALAQEVMNQVGRIASIVTCRGASPLVYVLLIHSVRFWTTARRDAPPRSDRSRRSADAASHSSSCRSSS